MKQKKKVCKRPVFLGLICVMLAACFLSMSLVTGSFARFQETKTGTGTADIADWSFLASVDKDADPATLETTLAATAEENAYVTNGFIAPGSSGYVPIFVNIAGTEVAMKLEVSATFENTLPEEIVFTDNFDRALTETVSGDNFVLAYSFYVPLSDVEAWNSYIDLGFNWDYPESAANDFNDGGVSHAMTLTVKASQVVGASDVTGLTEINFVANASEISTDANVRNILLDNIGAIDLDLTNDFELDLNEKAIGGDSTIDSAATVTAYLGTTRNDAANAGSFNNLVITAPNATVYQSANLLGNITVNSGDDCFYFTGDVAEDTVITVAGGKAVIKAAPRTNNPTIVVNKDTVTADTKEIVVVVEEKATVESVSVASVPANATVTLTNNGTIKDLTIDKILDADEAEVAFTFDVTNSGTIDQVIDNTEETDVTLDYSRSVKVVEYPAANVLQLRNAIALIAASAEKVGKVKLVADMEIVSAASENNAINLSSACNVTLDLNGYTISRTMPSGLNMAQRGVIVLNNENATLTVEDKSQDANGAIIGHTDGGTSRAIVVNAGKVVMNSGSLLADYAPVYVLGNNAYGEDRTAINSVLEINGGRVACLMNNYGIIIQGKGAELYVNGGTVIGQISGNGSEDVGKADCGNTYIEINGGTIECTQTDGVYDSAALYQPQDGILNITGGTFKGTEALSIKDGTVSISGGSFYAYGEKSVPPVGFSNGVEHTGAALSITSNADYIKDDDAYMQITVTGGTFVSANGNAVFEGIAVKNGAPMSTKPLISKLDILGGTFTADAAESDEVILVLNTSVAKIAAAYASISTVSTDNVQTIEVNSQESLTEAVATANAATSGTVVIKLTASFNYSGDQTTKLVINNVNALVVVDFNGYTITATDTANGSAPAYNFMMLVVQSDVIACDTSANGKGGISLTSVNNGGWGRLSAIWAITYRNDGVNGSFGGKLMILSGKYVHNGGTNMTYAVDVLAQIDTVSLYVYGGTLRSENYSAIRTCGMGSLANVGIIGGDIYGHSAAMYLQTSATHVEVKLLLSITGGNFSNNRATRACLYFDGDYATVDGTVIENMIAAATQLKYCVEINGGTFDNLATSDGSYTLVEPIPVSGFAGSFTYLVGDGVVINK